MGRRGVLRLDQILAARSEEELRQATQIAAKRLGFPYVVFCGSLSQPGEVREVRFDNLPEDWRRHCADRGRDLLPGSLRRLALEEVTPVLWCRAEPARSRSFAKARTCGLATGVSCSVRGPRGEWSLSSFALPCGGAEAEHHIAATLSDCQLVACAIHFAAVRIVRRAGDRALRLRPPGLLSQRERQCLIESARGKTISQIGQALQISERTVSFHLSNVRRKLDAANSRHAVTKALALKLIAAN